jgi:hypothetical protein
MTTSKSLPARPSLESLRKQAKKLARDIVAGDVAGIARARAQLPNIDLPLTQRNAQLARSWTTQASDCARYRDAPRTARQLAIRHFTGGSAHGIGSSGTSRVIRFRLLTYATHAP